ncbi:unnamed protein product [marine sediment metagenome]|uniref:Uncharacterized protein n=1 Tax=marine sediment metagenome TaxID=412755 RepID=X1CRT9_9ZZZZ
MEIKVKNLEDMWKTLDEKEQLIVIDFIEKILKSKRYKKLREEIKERREEVSKGEVISHEEIWNDV